MRELLQIRGCDDQLIKGNKWIIDEQPKKTIVIIHGMSEYSLRYDDFACFLNQNGYDVFALDHIGHGLNVDNVNEVMKWEKDTFFKCAENVKILVDQLKKENREVYIFAHSMGSFIGQLLIEKYPEITKKIVLSGTTYFKQKGIFVKSFLSIYRLLSFKGYKKAKIINFLSFSSYNNRVKNKESIYDWLSYNKENVQKYAMDPYSNAIPSQNFFSSLLSGMIFIGNKKNFKNISQNIKVLLVTGKDDPVGSYTKKVKKLHLALISRKISSRYIVYENMRHEILNELGNQKVYDDILKFFKED